MADLDTRIDQFRKMASDDPGNELGHFSLGRALLDAGRTAEAVESFDRALAINPTLSKAYQLAATALLKLDRRDEAVGRLTAYGPAASDRVHAHLQALKGLLAAEHEAFAAVEAAAPPVKQAPLPPRVELPSAVDLRDGSSATVHSLLAARDRRLS